MAYEIPPRAQGVIPNSAQAPLSLRYLHAAMISLVAVGLLIEGFRLAREPATGTDGLRPTGPNGTFSGQCACVA